MKVHIFRKWRQILSPVQNDIPLN